MRRPYTASTLVVPSRPAERSTRAHEESGIALLLTILMLLLVSAIGVSALNRAGDEQVVSAASRRQVTNVAAADAALTLVGNQLASSQVGAAPASTPLNLPTFVTDSTGLSTSIRTGTIGDPNPQSIIPIGTAAASDGGDLRVGKGAAPRLIYRVNVVATDPSGGNVQLQAQYAVRQN